MQDIFYNLNEVGDLSEEEHFSSEIYSAKLQTLGRELFPDFSLDNYEFSIFQRVTSHLQAYKLNKELRQIFLPITAAKYFWLTELASPIYTAGTQQDANRNFLFDDDYQIIRNYYKKWATASEGKEKTYFGLSLLNTLKRNFKEDSLFNLILSLNIVVFDSSLRDYNKAKGFIEKLHDVIGKSKVANEIKDEALEIISIYDGFNDLLEHKIDDANYSFFNVLVKNPNSPTGLFYYAYTQKVLGITSTALENFEKILKLDLQRLEYAVSNNNFSLFVFFMKSNVIVNIFFEHEFGNLFHEIKNLINNYLPMDAFLVDNIIHVQNNLRKLDLEEYYDEHVTTNLKFIENFASLYSINQSIFLRIMMEAVKGKAKEVINHVKSKINKTVNNRIAEELKIYDKQIADYNDKSQHLEKEIEIVKESTKTAIEVDITNYTLQINNRVAELEKTLARLDSEKESTAYESFNNYMVLNFIVSIVVFMVGGFINGFVGGASNIGSSEVMKNVFSTGFKWSGLVFILGIIVSVFSFASKVMEMNNRKQKLIKLISSIKSNRENDISEIKNSHNKKETIVIDSMNHRITEYKKMLEVVKKEREKQKIELIEQLKKETEKVLKELDSLIQIL